MTPDPHHPDPHHPDLHHPDPHYTAFRWWMVGASVSTLGDAVTFFALAWVAASHGPGTASMVVLLESVPLVLFILLGGALADRCGPRRVMIACDAFMALVMAAFALGALVEVPVWALAAVALLSGTAAAVRRPASGVFPRLFFRGDQLSKAMAAATFFQQVAQAAGAALGGLLLATGGVALTAGADAVTFLVVGVVLLAVRPPRESTGADGDGSALLRQVHEGISAARTTPGAPATLLAVVGMASTALPLVSLCVPLLGHARDWTAGQTGLVSGAWVVGGMLVMVVVSRRGMVPAPVSLAGPVLAAAGTVLLMLTRSPAAGALALAAVGTGISMLTTRLFPRFMDATPAELLSRFSAMLGLAQTAPMLVVTAVLGGLISAAGPAVALVGIAVVLAGTTWPAARAEARLGVGQTGVPPEPRRPAQAPT